MKHEHYTDVPIKFVKDNDTKGVRMRIGISDQDGAPNFVMRLFQVARDGHSPLHSHPWEHEVFIVAGQGKLVLENEERELKKGDFVFVEPNLLHQFRNNGQEEFQFICVVPRQE